MAAKGISHANYDRLYTEPVIDGMPIERLRLTELNVPTGELVVTDPLVVPDLLPFARKVAPGLYPVDLYIAQTPISGERVAIAMLTFSQDVAIRYELALRGSQKLEELEDERSYFGFPVDAGLGAIYDQETSIAYNRFIDDFYRENPVKNIYDDLLAAEFKRNAHSQSDPNDCGNWLDFHLPDSMQHNIAMFQSGYGDGVYPAYWGLNAREEIINLVIDFHVILLPD
jgi:hypothetical protein